MAKINFDNSTRSRALMHATTISTQLREWQGCAPNFADYERPIEQLMTRALQWNDFKPELISEYLAGLKPEECYIMFASQIHKQKEPAEKFEVEPIYTTEFVRIKQT